MRSNSSFPARMRTMCINHAPFRLTHSWFTLAYMLWSRTSSRDSFISSTLTRLPLLARPLSFEEGLEEVDVECATGSMLIEGGDGRLGLLLLVIVDDICLMEVLVGLLETSCDVSSFWLAAREFGQLRANLSRNSA